LKGIQIIKILIFWNLCSWFKKSSAFKKLKKKRQKINTGPNQHGRTTPPWIGSRRVEGLRRTWLLGPSTDRQDHRRFSPHFPSWQPSLPPKQTGHRAWEDDASTHTAVPPTHHSTPKTLANLIGLPRGGDGGGGGEVESTANSTPRLRGGDDASTATPSFADIVLSLAGSCSGHRPPPWLRSSPSTLVDSFLLHRAMAPANLGTVRYCLVAICCSVWDHESQCLIWRIPGEIFRALYANVSEFRLRLAVLILTCRPRYDHLIGFDFNLPSGVSSSSFDTMWALSQTGRHSFAGALSFFCVTLESVSTMSDGLYVLPFIS
jgi:hypothetical protein